MRLRKRLAMPFALLALAGCGQRIDKDAPLAFVPADTPYVFANSEPIPEAATARWQEQMQAMWPVMLAPLDKAMADLDRAHLPKNAAPVRVIRALIDEIRGRDTLAKWREIGLSPTTHFAFYGVGLIPVLRLELADADAFRAAIARIEQASASTLDRARIGTQEILTIGTAVQAVIAIERKHLVVSVLPAAADDTLKRRVLGIDRPARSLAESGEFVAFNDARGYLPYGSGWIDTRRSLDLAETDPGIAAFVRVAGGKPPEIDPACRTEFDAVAGKMPRLAGGYTAFDDTRVTIHARVDLAPDLAKKLIALAAATPGTIDADALFDIAIALPVLRVRDFWVAQADAVAAAPFHCTLLAPLNAVFAALKLRLDRVIPPPLADLSGLRASASRVEWPQHAARPDVEASVLVGSANPSFLLNLARVSVPALRTLELAADGTPTAIPQTALPDSARDMTFAAAMSGKAIAIATGRNEIDRLATRVNAAPGQPGVLVDAAYSGHIYSVFADAMQHFAERMPAEQRAQFDMQRKLYAYYAQWFRRFGIRVAIVAEGIDVTETVELVPR